MDIIEQFLTIQMILFCLVIFVLVWIQRKVVEVYFPKVKASKLWTEFFLPLGPCGTGFTFAAIVKSYPFPAILDDTWLNRGCLGIGCGIFAAYVYRMINAAFNKKIGTDPAKDDPSNLLK